MSIINKWNKTRDILMLCGKYNESSYIIIIGTDILMTTVIDIKWYEHIIMGGVGQYKEA